MAFTFFFRDPQVLDRAVTAVLPIISGSSKPLVWDAGCAMGPEPYTLAIMLAERMGKFGFRNLQIYATDIDESGQFGDIIKKGEYPEEPLTRIPPEIFSAYFTQSRPGFYIISDSIRTSVQYHKHDLLSLKPIREGFSMVVCKNVLLHFTQEQRVEVIKMFHRVLLPGGILAIEQTQKMPDDIAHLFDKAASDAQVFRKK